MQGSCGRACNCLCWPMQLTHPSCATWYRGFRLGKCASSFWETISHDKVVSVCSLTLLFSSHTPLPYCPTQPPSLFPFFLFSSEALGHCSLSSRCVPQETVMPWEAALIASLSGPCFTGHILLLGAPSCQGLWHQRVACILQGLLKGPVAPSQRACDTQAGVSARG